MKNINEEEGACTQPSNIGNEKISIFGSDAGNELKVKDSNDFYKQLLEVDDVESDSIYFDKLNELIAYLNEHTDYSWDANEMYDNCAIAESDEDYIEVFIELDENDNYTYTVDGYKYNSLEDLVKNMPVLYDGDTDPDYGEGWEEDEDNEEYQSDIELDRRKTDKFLNESKLIEFSTEKDKDEYIQENNLVKDKDYKDKGIYMIELITH